MRRKQHEIDHCHTGEHADFERRERQGIRLHRVLDGFLWREMPRGPDGEILKGDAEEIGKSERGNVICVKALTEECPAVGENKRRADEVADDAAAAAMRGRQEDAFPIGCSPLIRGASPAIGRPIAV